MQRCWLDRCWRKPPPTTKSCVSARSAGPRRLRQQQAPDVRLPRPEAAPDADATDLPTETPCYPIDQLNLEGERLRSFTFPARARRLCRPLHRARGLNRIVKRLSAQVVAEGYVTTRIGIPEQDLGSRRLRLLLVPALSAPSALPMTRRPATGAAPSRFALATCFSCAILNRAGTDEAHPLAGRHQHRAGRHARRKRLVIHVKRQKPWRLGVTLDDAGSRSTGKLQASASLSIDNPLGVNDLFSVSLNNDAERDTPVAARAATRLPVRRPLGLLDTLAGRKQIALPADDPGHQPDLCDQRRHDQR